MNVKKAGLITAGVLAATVAVAPLAFATDGHHGHDDGKACAFVGGDGGAASEISGDSLANAVVQAPVAGNNIGNAANCSDFLNNNGNGNGSGNQISVLGGLLP